MTRTIAQIRNTKTLKQHCGYHEDKIITKITDEQKGLKSLNSKEFYFGILTALSLISIHNQEVIYRDIINIIDENELIKIAKEENQIESSGLIKYGYIK